MSAAVDRLRAAAAHLRDLSEDAMNAVGTEWKYEHHGFHQVVGEAGPIADCALCAYRPEAEGKSGPHGIAKFPEEVAVFIGAMSPALADAVAEWLDVTSDDLASLERAGATFDGPYAEPALAVADAALGVVVGRVVRLADRRTRSTCPHGIPCLTCRVHPTEDCPCFTTRATTNR